jgi:hypothetical protein
VSVPEFQYAPLPGRGGLVYGGKVFLKWNTRADGSGTNYNPGDKVQLVSDMVLYAQWEPKKSGKTYKTFWAQDTDGNWYTVEAVKRKDGDKCIVYTDILADADIDDSVITGIQTKYDTAIHDKITGAFGDVSDMDGNSQVILLLLDIKDGYTGSGGYVAGYFDFTHMYGTETFSFSNKADMLFIDTYPGLSQMGKLYSTVAHELQHLIHFSRTVKANPSKNEKDLWINEGLSTAAEYIYDQSDTSRIKYFNDSNTLTNGDYRTIPYGNNFFVWNGFWEQEYGDVLADYATAYLFFRWLGIHGGQEIYKDIIASSWSDYRAVTEAAKTSSMSSLFTEAQNTDEKRWEKLLSTWMLANYYNSSSGTYEIYGYKGGISPLTVAVPNIEQNPWPFSPGEGIFSSLTVPFSPPNSGDHIRYRGLGGSSGSPAIDDSSPYYGTALLTFNASTNKDGPDETGYLASVAGTGTGPALSVQSGGPPIRAVNAGSDPYPVSFGDKAAGLDKPKDKKAAPRSKPGKR